MIFYEIKDQSDGQILVSTVSECPFGSSYKTIEKSESGWSIRILASRDEELAKSTRIAARTIKAFAEMASVARGMKKKHDSGYKAFFHNLVTTHAQLQGEIESIIPEVSLIDAENHSQQLAIAREAVRKNPGVAAEALLEILKRTGDLQAQIHGLRILTNDVAPDFAVHNIEKVLFRIIQPFLEKFHEANLDIRVHAKNAEERKVVLDYRLFNVAMHQFLSNAIKYAKPNSYIDITFDIETTELQMTMISVQIEPGELEKIFEFGESGINARAFSGDGIGMYMIKKALEIMNTEMKIFPDPAYQENIYGVPYCKNIFTIPLRAA